MYAEPIKVEKPQEERLVEDESVTEELYTALRAAGASPEEARSCAQASTAPVRL